jgi:hypothetical protein
VKRRTIQIGSYVIDASIREVHTFESEVTQFPVEKGSPISDNVRPKPITVVIEGIVSNTPLPPIAQGRAVVGSGVGDGDDSPPSVSALAALQAIRDAREPVTISTALKSYDNMAMQNLEVTVDATTGEALSFTATFLQITIVTTTRATLRTAQVRTARPQDAAKTNADKAAVQVTIPTGILVITLPLTPDPTTGWNSLLDQWTALYGPPILQDSVGYHFRVYDPTQTIPDGYIAQDNQYHPLDTSDELGILEASVGAYTPPATGDSATDSSSYDPSVGTWVNQQGLPVTSAPPSNVDQYQFPGVPNK